MTVTWTSGYDIHEVVPFVEWGPKGGRQGQSAAETLTFNRNSMCGEPGRTVGWRDPGFIHTSFQHRILSRAGLGDETCLPKGITSRPPNICMEVARQEEEVVMFGALYALFAKTSVNSRDIDIL